MHKHTDTENTEIETTVAAGIELVDIDDLRAAFGGEGLSAGASAQIVKDAPSTVMCPTW